METASLAELYIVLGLHRNENEIVLASLCPYGKTDASSMHETYTCTSMHYILFPTCIMPKLAAYVSCIIQATC